MCGFCNVWVFLVICVLVFTVFCIVCTVFLYCLIYAYLILFVTSVSGPGSVVGTAIKC